MRNITPTTLLQLKKAKVNNMNKHSILYKTLARALSIKRPHGTLGTTQFNAWLLDRIPEGFKPTIDKAGNIHIDARVHDNNRTLFVAHVDTVHKVIGANKIRKTRGMWYASGAPLGADDGAGCAVLMHLLCGGVPAYYIFTQGEECGGIGARHIAEHNKDLLKQFDRAIAFDRRGIDSVITHQGYGRCCSDEFADALSDALSADETLMYSPDDGGVYTDTAEFTDIIPECTNLSVGYYSEHTENERLDVYHLEALAARCLLIDWDGLPSKRDPSVYESKWDDKAYAYGPYTNDDKTWDKGWQDKMWTTSVDGSFVPYDDDEDDYRIALREALYDALSGDSDYLLDLMCNAVYPEDPELARRFIDTRTLTEDVLEEALAQSNTYDAHTVLMSLFDTAHCEA